MRDVNHLPPVVVVGGMANALSVARSLGRAGVKVYAINEPCSHVRFSRFCYKCIEFPWARGVEKDWTAYLLGSQSDHLRGAVLMACCDEAIQLITENREQLAGKFILDESNPQAQLWMLDKLSTYQQARAAGVSMPRFWTAASAEEVARFKDELVFPLIVKPLLSHVFKARFGTKFVQANSYDELCNVYRQINDTGIATMLVEHIPGPDDRLCSYYTYLDERSQPLFHFTKRLIRRYPVGWGTGCYHVTDWNPEVRDLALPLFQHVGLRGLANAEFKRDDRDGKLKLIECNARFTAANCVVTASGFDLPLFVYNRLVGRPQVPLEKYRTGVRLWYPLDDYLAFRVLRRRGELTLGGWLKSLCHRKKLPFFQWTDPVPSIAAGLQWLGMARAFSWMQRKIRRAAHWMMSPVRGRRPQVAPQECSDSAHAGLPEGR